jgi:hypothetical protein
VAIVVTGSRIMRRELLAPSPVVAITAEQEELGDLKLYRIPEPVTVAANAQKQVALLTKPGVRYERLYGADLSARGEREPQPVAMLIRLENEKRDGLGVPLPSGTAAVFEMVGGRPMLAGEAPIEDSAVGQEIDLRVGESTQVTIRQRGLEDRRRLDKDGEILAERYEVTISNATRSPIVVETLLRLFGDDWRLVQPSRKLALRNGRNMWRATVRANGRKTLSYTLERVPDPAPVEDEDDEEGE